MTLTPDELDAMERRVEGATPDLDAIEARHTRTYDGGSTHPPYLTRPYCRYCGSASFSQWPCDAAALIAEVRRLRALVEEE